MKKKENKKIVPVILIAVAIIIAIVSYQILPEHVAIQFNTKGEARMVNKFSAVLIPLVISVIGAFLYIENFYNDEANKYIGVSVVGYVVAIIEIVINLFFFKG